jgi:hypothetical protein
VDNYGTFLSPELEINGPWRLQTDYPLLIELMQQRHWQKSSPWKQVGCGTSFIYCRGFYCSRDAKNSVTRILQKLPAEGFEFVELRQDIGWEIRIPSSPQVPQNSCAYAGLNQEHHSSNTAGAVIKLITPKERILA